MFRWKEDYTAYLLILPAIVYVAFFSFVPSIQAVYGSFQTPSKQFVLSNYQLLFQGTDLRNSIYNTVVVTLLALAIQFLVAMVIATILMKEFRGKNFFQVGFMIPFGVATIVASYVFGNDNIFAISGGYANTILHYIGLPQPQWINPNSYIFNVLGLVIADSWKNTPIVAIVLLAGMTTIPPDIYAAATVDGAGAISRFLRITLPNLSNYIAIALIIRGVSEFNIFAMAQFLFPHKILTTLVFSYYGISGTTYLSYAVATILLAFIVLFSTLVLLYRSWSQKS